MRTDRPIYRNHQTCPDTDHQTLPRLCHEAVLYNRLREMGLIVKDVRFPLSRALLYHSVRLPLAGLCRDALLMTMERPGQTQNW